MIHEIMRLVETELQSRGCPLRVEYGPERGTANAMWDSRIVFERVRARQSEAVLPPQSPKNNPLRRKTRMVEGVVRILARSTVGGARVEDHELLADQAIDLVIVALEIAGAKKKLALTVTSGGMLSSADVERIGLEQWPGVVYELRFNVRRAVYDRTWAGDAKQTLPLADVQTTGTCVSETVGG